MSDEGLQRAAPVAQDVLRTGLALAVQAGQVVAFAAAADAGHR